MDAVRYYLALVLIMMTPGALLFWFSVHPFLRFWRRVGPVGTYAIHFSGMALMAAGVFLIRGWLLSSEFGTNRFLIALAIPFLLAGAVISLQRRKQLSAKILTGLSELSPEKHEGKLVTGGIYSRIRHPRYAEVLLFFAAYALITNYLVMYVVLLLSMLAVVGIVRFEERELIERFGDEYVQYCERVPRFVPRLHTKQSPRETSAY